MSSSDDEYKDARMFTDACYVLSRLFDSGIMHDLVKEHGYEPMPIMKYVRLDVNGVLHVLVSQF